MHIDNGIGGEGMKTLKSQVESIAEKRIDGTNELTGDNLNDIYSGIQMLGHIVMTLERFSRIENGIDTAAESYSRIDS